MALLNTDSLPVGIVVPIPTLQESSLDMSSPIIVLIERNMGVPFFDPAFGSIHVAPKSPANF